MSRLFLALSAFLICVLAETAHAGPIIVPPSLRPGDHYQLLFVTRDSVSALSTNIADYNKFVTMEATGLTALLSQQPVTWTAIASTPFVNAISNAPQLDAVYDLLGARITTLDADHGLYHTSTTPLEQLPDVDQFGTRDPASYGERVWTGSAPNGYEGVVDVYSPQLMAVISVPSGLGTQSPIQGFDTVTGPGYIASTPFGYPPAQFAHLYALSSELVVLPEPSTIVILGGGLLGLAFYQMATGARRKQLPELPISHPR